jgi:hypothetical protein
LRDEHSRNIEPARAIAAETLTLERTLTDLVNQAYALTSPAQRQVQAGARKTKFLSVSQ